MIWTHTSIAPGCLDRRLLPAALGSEGGGARERTVFPLLRQARRKTSTRKSGRGKELGASGLARADVVRVLLFLAPFFSRRNRRQGCQALTPETPPSDAKSVGAWASRREVSAVDDGAAFDLSALNVQLFWPSPADQPRAKGGKGGQRTNLPRAGGEQTSCCEGEL